MICQKNGGFILKTGSFFLPFFAEKGWVSDPSKKNPYQKKTEVVKKGEGGGLSFLTESKKKIFFSFSGPIKTKNFFVSSKVQVLEAMRWSQKNFRAKLHPLERNRTGR